MEGKMVGNSIIKTDWECIEIPFFGTLLKQYTFDWVVQH